MAIRNLDTDFLKTFKITESFDTPKRGGQKEVHFVVSGGKKMVMKLFHTSGIDERAKRELNIYEKFKGIDGIPKIVSVHLYEGELVVFEEYVSGHCLSDIFSNYKNDIGGVTELIKNLCTILSPIWEANYIHRDIKPGNIIIRGGGKPVLLDFGIARDLLDSSITGTGFQPFSWQFGAPEQYAGRKDLVEYRTDFFSLGVLAYYLFHNNLPFGDSKDLIEKKFKSGVDSFPIKEKCELKAFCTEAMKFSPSERPRLLTDFLNLLP